MNSTEARSYSRANLVIFEEVTAIMRAVMNASDSGEYSIVLNDGTLMTASTPKITVDGTVADPVIVNGDTITLNAITYSLGASGTNLNSIIADINDTSSGDIVASKTSDNKLSITYTTLQSDWTLTVGEGTANAALGLTSGIITAENPESVNYYNSWKGISSLRKLDDEVARVRAYFESLGYNISISDNTSTQSTFVWNLFW